MEILQKLTKVHYPHSELDPETKMLRSANRTPARGYVVPPRFDPKSSPYYFPHDPNAPRMNLQPQGQPELAKKKTRPDWIGGFL